MLSAIFFLLLTCLRSQHPEARGHLSEALTEDTGVGNSVAGSPLPLTTGNENLDVAIVIHLQYCNHLIQVETQPFTNGKAVISDRYLDISRDLKWSFVCV